MPDDQCEQQHRFSPIFDWLVSIRCNSLWIFRQNPTILCQLSALISAARSSLLRLLAPSLQRFCADDRRRQSQRYHDPALPAAATSAAVVAPARQISRSALANS